jgi:cytochrome P450
MTRQGDLGLNSQCRRGETYICSRAIRFSSGLTWALFALSQDPRVQAKLREELLTVNTDNPTMDVLNALPYLDMVVRETLRIHCPIAASVRAAINDDMLPLSTPITDRKGRVHEHIK